MAYSSGCHVGNGKLLCLPVSLYCARDTLPSFSKGKEQLSGIEVEQTRNIAIVRSYIRLLRFYDKSCLSDNQLIHYVMSWNGDAHF